MYSQADLLDTAVATIIPKQPLLLSEYSTWFVAGIMVPLVLTWANDRVSWMSLPINNAITRTCQTNLRVVDIAEPNIEHVKPVSVVDDLASCYLVLLPRVGFVCFEDWVDWEL